LTLMLSLPVLTWIRFIVWLGVGLTIYFLYGYKHSVLRQEEEAILKGLQGAKCS
jgi:basic amino acid/polyamine antiporter, APA family